MLIDEAKLRVLRAANRLRRRRSKARVAHEAARRQFKQFSIDGIPRR
jgi:hypothetical protein